jgi:hypothetical protein
MSKTVSPSPLDQRLERLERRIASQRTHLARRSRFTVLIALILLIVLAGYFYFGYKSFDEVTRPKTLVQVAESIIDRNLPEVRKSLQDEIVRSAPGWAEQLSGEIQSGMPRAREQLENYILDQMDKVLHETNAMSQEQFRTFLKENRPLLEQGFRDLATSPTVAEETMQNVIDALDKQFAKQMQVESSDLFDTVSQMKRKLDRLASAQNLNSEQQLERRMLMLTRRMKSETFESTSSANQVAGQGAPAAVTPVAAAEGEPQKADETPDDSTKTDGDAKADGDTKDDAKAGDKDAEPQAGSGG